MAIFTSTFSASFSLEDFVGHGALQSILPSLVQEGWDDVPTLKMMSSQDMDAQKLTPQQRDALEIRIYLHDRSLMQYADKLEASGKSLPELLSARPAALSSHYAMKRGHVARFIDRSVSCGLQIPPAPLTSAAHQKTIALVPASRPRVPSISTQHPTSPPSNNSTPLCRAARPCSTSLPPATDQTEPPLIISGSELQQPVTSLDQPSHPNNAAAAESEKPDKPHVPLTTLDPASFKGVVSAGPAKPRLCGLVKPSRVAEDIIPISVLEKVSVQKLAPEYHVGVDPWGKSDIVRAPPPMKASDIWSTKPTILYCIRRPGCVMCRAEAHQLYSRKPIFDALGVQLVAVLHEHIDSEVRFFWPRFWGGMIVVDKACEIFKALGGGKLPTDNYVTGLLFNSVARRNLRRARESGIHNNLHGNGLVKGGLLVVRSGKGGVAYQFAERNIGDWAPLEEVLDVCGRLIALGEGRNES